jgi:hypothetical protein
MTQVSRRSLFPLISLGSAAVVAPVVVGGMMFAAPREKMKPLRSGDGRMVGQINQLVRAVNRLNGFTEEVV